MSTYQAAPAARDRAKYPCILDYYIEVVMPASADKLAAQWRAEDAARGWGNSRDIRFTGKVDTE